MGFFIGEDFTARSHLNSTTTRAVGHHDAGTTINNGPCGEIWTLNMFHQAIDINIGVINQRQAGINDFSQVMGRNISRHPHRDTAGAINQQIRDL